jgi:hypothetical protein
VDDREVIEHAERHLGPFLRAHPLEHDSGRDLGLGVFFFASPSMVTVVTIGLRARMLRSPLPHELACSVHPGQEDHAERLVERFARLSVLGDVELEYDDGLLVDEPLVPDTEIRGLLAAPHPYTDEMFNMVRDADGTLSLQFITLVPITGPEGAYLRDHETGELFELWESAGTDLLDLRRVSVV